MFDKALLAVFIYLIAIIAIIAIATWIEKNKEKHFYLGLARLLHNNELDDASLKSLISSIKIKRHSVISALNKLYLNTRLAPSTEDIHSKHKQVAYELLNNYEKEINFPDLPKTLQDKIQLLKEQSPQTEELIRQLAYVINDIYLVEKKHKWFSMLIAIISLTLTAISFFPKLFDYIY